MRGSVKSNIGHLDAAAGVAGLIKTILALQHRQLPPTLHFRTPNPKIDFANSPFYVNATLKAWESNGRPRRAGVSSYGTEFPAEASISKLTTAEGPLFTVILRDITLRKQVETRLRTSLHEKEILLQEVHHRVKNNLQVIASLLRLQASSIADPALQGLFRDSQNQVYAIALVHEQLYQVPDLAHVDFTVYLRELAGRVVRSYMTQNAGIELTFDTDEAVALDIDTAIPLGLILTELVSNSVKHAFRDGEPGTITIGLHAEAGIVTLTVRDDGAGLPKAFDLQMTGSLGLQLVGDLTEQLGGTITVGCSCGTLFQIHIPHVSKLVVT